jgi:hypothetical protein
MQKINEEKERRRPGGREQVGWTWSGKQDNLVTVAFGIVSDHWTNLGISSCVMLLNIVRQVVKDCTYTVNSLMQFDRLIIATKYTSISVHCDVGACFVRIADITLVTADDNCFCWQHGKLQSCASVVFLRL